MRNLFDWITGGLKSLNDQGLLRKCRSTISLPDGWCQVDGKRLRNFAGNDYLDLSHDPRVVAAAMEALKEGGAGATASALVTGRTIWHAELEACLAKFTCQPAALLFPTGYAANTGTIPALAGQGDLIFSDHLNHRSLIDGCRLSNARVQVYPHGEMESLQRELAQSTDARRRLIVTDSLFSMDGDFAPLKDLCELAERFEAMLMIDEAHTVGVSGENGRGAAEMMGLEHRIPVRIGTLSKALGSQGGFVTGSRELIDWLWNQARPHMFSTALPPSACAAATAAVTIVEQEPWRRQQLLERGAELRSGLREMLGTSSEAKSIPLGTENFVARRQPPLRANSPVIERNSAIRRGGSMDSGFQHDHSQIVVIIVDSPDGAIDAQAKLAERGFLVAAIRPPTVPAGLSRLRISLTSAHTREDIHGLLGALNDVLAPRRD